MERKSRKPHEKSTEELLKNEKFLKMAIAMTAIAAGLMLVIGIYLSVKSEKFNPIAAVSVSMLPLVLVNAMNLKAIQAEKKSRGL